MRESQTPLPNPLPGVPGRGSNAARVAIALVLIIAAALRLHDIDRQSLWFDEAASVHIARLSPVAMLDRIKDEERTPPLHYAILAAWMRVFGDSETSLRMPSAIASIAAVFLLYLLVRRLFGPAAGIGAALLLALSRYQINYAQEARAYSLMLLLGLWSCDLFVRLMQRPTRRVEVGYVIVTALLLYSHLYGVFVIAAQWLTFLLRHPAFPTRRWLLLNIIVVALFAPWLPTAIAWTRSVATAFFWVTPLTFADIGRAYRLYAGSWPLLLVLLGLAIVGALRAPNREGRVLMIALATLPVLVPGIASILGKPTFTDRYGIVAPAGLYALAALGVAAVPHWIGRVVLILGLCILSLNGRASDWNKPDWRTAGQYLTANMRPTDIAVINRKVGTYLYEYYIGRSRPEMRPRGFDSPAIPLTLPLPRGQHVWLIVHSEFVTADQIVARAPWRVISDLRLGEGKKAIEIMELEDATPTTPASSQPTTATRPTTATP